MAKITLMHYSAPPIVGGVESVMSHHARLIADAGHQVTIITGRGKQTDPRISLITVPLMDSRNPDILAAKTELDRGVIPGQFGLLVDQLTTTLEENLSDQDWVIAHNVGSLNKNLPFTVALKMYIESKQTPHLILWHHDLAWTTPRYQKELHPGFPWDLLKTPWKNTRQVVVSNLRQMELAQLYGIPQSSIKVIPNGLDLKHFLKLEDQTEFFVERLELLSAKPLLLLPVRITTRKNIELALRTLSCLKSAFPQAMLVVTGPLGPHNPANLDYFSRLLALREDLNLENSAHFLEELTDDYLPDAVIADFYRFADALILPSREEGFGIPILEAGLAGIPIFCSDIPPLRELGGDQIATFSPQAEPHEVADIIVNRMTGDTIFNLRTNFRNTYTWERIYHNEIAPIFEI